MSLEHDISRASFRNETPSDEMSNRVMILHCKVKASIDSDAILGLRLMKHKEGKPAQL